MIDLVKRYPWPSAVSALVAATLAGILVPAAPGRADAAARLSPPAPAMDATCRAPSDAPEAPPVRAAAPFRYPR